MDSLEGLLAVAAALAAGSISLIGFGIDSFIEVISGATLLWRMPLRPDGHGWMDCSSEARVLPPCEAHFVRGPRGQICVEEDLAKHVGRKTIPSEFFKLEGADNISALLFSNAGTIAKFSRMGVLKNPVPGMIIARFGTECDDDPKAIMPAAFAYSPGQVWYWKIS